jgi:hypothetical protein
LSARSPAARAGAGQAGGVDAADGRAASRGGRAEAGRARAARVRRGRPGEPQPPPSDARGTVLLRMGPRRGRLAHRATAVLRPRRVDFAEAPAQLPERDVTARDRSAAAITRRTSTMPRRQFAHRVDQPSRGCSREAGGVAMSPRCERGAKATRDAPGRRSSACGGAVASTSSRWPTDGRGRWPPTAGRSGGPRIMTVSGTAPGK